MEKKVTKRVSVGQTNCRYTVPASWEDDSKCGVFGETRLQKRYESDVKDVIVDFIDCIFNEFMPLYEKVYKSKYKAQIEITAMRKMSKSYMDVTLLTSDTWHPDKTMEWTSKCLHWLLNTGRTFDRTKFLESIGINDQLSSFDTKRIVNSLDTEPFKSQNICRFEEIRDGYRRLLTHRKYKNTAVKCLVQDCMFDASDEEQETAVRFLDHLLKQMIGRRAEKYVITADILRAVTTQFRRVFSCMQKIYDRYTTNRVGRRVSSTATVLHVAARSFGHDKTVSEMINGYNLASKYGCYRGKLTINMVNNAINAMKIKNEGKIDESDYPFYIENGV
jgi:Mg2+ and Co2+ transporter CorA